MRRRLAVYFETDKPRVEVIPMIDIMMFLLVFFIIVTLKMIAGTGIAMDLPGSATTQELRSTQITVGVTGDGRLVVDGHTITGAELTGKLVELKGDQQVQVIVAGDRDVSLETLVGVMDAVRSAGINTVGIAAKAQAR
ncbi:MAG TPA: biopolymer transporter ExbD [Burkholderiales bacterium]|nr:biopolymer transporter ExbD [Burkholderiales bacterium]